MSFRSYIYGISLWLIVLLMVACERTHPQVQALLQHADALMEAHPDSAFSLLDSLHYRQPMSQKETARYVLLLAKATDKTYQSLIPCDSLLNFALKYYEKPTPERATALLYKGCLEDEVNHDEEAIEHLQEARLILKDYPDEVGTRRITLGLLGDLYYQHKHYEDCLPVYQETLELCESDRDKAITFQDIGSYYTMTEEKDSAYDYHKKAIEHALLTKDSSLIANSYRSLALAYNVFYESDSLLHYLTVALDYAPDGRLKSQILYLLGEELYESNKDEAVSYIYQAINDSAFVNSEQVLDNLSIIEKDRGNLDAAYEYLQEYVTWLESLYADERSVDVQQLIYDYDTKLQLQTEQSIAKQRQSNIIILFCIVCFIIVTTFIYLYNRKRKNELMNKHKVEVMKQKLISIQEKMSDYQQTLDAQKVELTEKIKDNERLTALIEKVSENQSSTEAEKVRLEATVKLLEKTLKKSEKDIQSLSVQTRDNENLYEMLQKRMNMLVSEDEKVINRLKKDLQEKSSENDLLMISIRQSEQYAKKMQAQGLKQCAEKFLKTDICRYAIRLSEDTKIRMDLPILNVVQRKTLRKEVSDIFKDYIEETKKRYPRLKEEDMIFLCLEASELSYKAISICLGHPKANAIYQIKRRISKKMETSI